MGKGRELLFIDPVRDRTAGAAAGQMLKLTEAVSSQEQTLHQSMERGPMPPLPSPPPSHTLPDPHLAERSVKISWKEESGNAAHNW